ncbi:adenylate/guanylate cyclase domain-containing protein [Aliishimia ponticola]|uniref:Adenylate/guanylate cyclase domain-containing protein n=1 Tax=Aliishimia ponticola TaxID=2499833 RepID=A0A4S4N9U3_9RHOB|nr:adenylate/guanylate cyclase domain-containing protein [Aliishimia ponticola]THH36032.1 adenylate/guanylate cyclase domain-containing protein [Aliishimia ponticola]
MTQAPAIQRKLTTILAADAANFSGRMATDEVATIQALRRSRSVIEGCIAIRGGRVANTAGDGLIAEFPSVVEAVAAAVTIQRSIADAPDLLAFRIGLHLGDVIVEGDDLLGDGVNLAARLEQMAPEGGILVSRQVVDQARGRLDADFRPLAPVTPKHMRDEIEVYGVIADGVKEPGNLAPVLHRTEPPADKAAPAKSKKPQTRYVALTGFVLVVDLLTDGAISWSLLPAAFFGYRLFRARQTPS